MYTFRQLHESSVDTNDMNLYVTKNITVSKFIIIICTIIFYADCDVILVFLFFFVRWWRNKEIWKEMTLHFL